MKRRTFLIGSTVVAGGALVVGFRVRNSGLDAKAKSTAKPGEILLGGWVKIAGDGMITVLVPHCDMGQGTHTAVAMMLAEELDADWKMVHAERAPAETAFANNFIVEGYLLGERKIPHLFDSAVAATFGEAARLGNVQLTGGSLSVRMTGNRGFRAVGAAARSMLMQAAAKQLGVPLTELRTADSRVIHKASGRSVGYGELATAAAEFSAPSKPELKKREDFRIIGTSPQRFDIPAKATGRMIYDMDMKLPGMKVATVMAAPVHGGKLIQVDEAPAMKIAGVEHVVKLPNAVMVIANGYWQARQGLLALQPQWGDGGHSQVSTASLAKQNFDALAGSEGKLLFKVGDVGKVPTGTTVEATYDVPYLHHVTMEPINATAQWTPEKLTVWSGEQDALGAKARVLKISGLKDAQVELIGMPVGGGFGRRGTTRRWDHLEQVLAAAKRVAPNPVKLIWSREEDFAQGNYRPMVASTIRTAVDDKGQPLAWRQRMIDTPDLFVEEAADLFYSIPHQVVTIVSSPSHVMSGAWRSVAASQNCFYRECFMDELAHAAKKDAFEYRRDLLDPASRYRKVLEEAAKQGKWGSVLPPGRGRGIALIEAYGSIVATVIEAEVGANDVIKVHRVTTVVDCGMVVHPNTATQQIEGATVMGLSAALGEQITIDKGAVVQRNLHDYPVLKLAEVPIIDVHFLSSDGPVGGIGEVGLPPVAPALVNALFAANGVRRRSLPLRKSS